MDDLNNHNIEERKRKFWERFSELILNEAVAPNSRPWYLKHAQRFVEACDTPLKAVLPEAVDHYFSELGRNSSIPDWQAAQHVHAIRILLENLVKCPWASEYPWLERMDSFRELESGHGTLARRESLSPEMRAEAQEIADTNLENRDLDQLDQLKGKIRARHLAWRTEQTYGQWVQRWMKFERFNDNKEEIRTLWRDEKDLKSEENLTAMRDSIRRYLNHLAVNRGVAGSTQAQALNALIFFARHVIDVEPGDLGDFKRPRPRKTLPVTLSKREVRKLLDLLKGRYRLIEREQATAPGRIRERRPFGANSGSLKSTHPASAGLPLILDKRGGTYSARKIGPLPLFFQQADPQAARNGAGQGKRRKSFGYRSSRAQPGIQNRLRRVRFNKVGQDRRDYLDFSGIH